MRYCPTCRRHFAGDGPPYSVLHVLGRDEHLQPVTRVPARALPDTRMPLSYPGDDRACTGEDRAVPGPAGLSRAYPGTAAP